LLTCNKLEQKLDNAIYLNDLARYFAVKTFWEIPLLHFMQKHPQVKLIVTNVNFALPKKDPEFEKTLPGINQFRRMIATDQNAVKKTVFDKLGYSNSEVKELLADAHVKANADGSASIDNESPLWRIINGKRETACQPDNYKNKIYFIGTCHFFGINAPYDKTIESYLQKMLNDDNLPYRVENEGQHFVLRFQDIFYNLNKLDCKAGDIIFVLSHFKPVDLPFLDLQNPFEGCDYREIFPYRGHLDEVGYKILVEKYFNYLTENDFFKHTDFEYPPPHLYRIVMVYRRKIFQSKNRLQKNFSTNRNWKITGKGCVSDDLKSVA